MKTRSRTNTSTETKTQGLNVEEYIRAYMRFSKTIWQYVHAKTGRFRLSDDIVQRILIDFWEIRGQVDPDKILETLYALADKRIKPHGVTPQKPKL